jgi:hypothetical protein
MKRILIILFVVFSLASCTENTRAKSFGGTMEVMLPQNTKLITVTWKENELWYLTRERNADESIDVYTFKEESTFGMMEGTVVLKEN